MSAALVSLMLADGRLPTGGHTQSSGLEAAVRAGLEVADVRDYARDRLATVIRVDAGTAVIARHLTLTGTDPLTLVPHWAARTPSRTLREVAGRTGRGYLRLAERLWPGIIEHLPRDTEVPRPIVLGVLAAVTDLSARGLAEVIAYDDVQTVTSASLKLLPVDPAAAASWIVDLHPAIEACVAAVADPAAPLTSPEQIPSCGAPLIDQRAEQHARTRMRLFHA